MKATYDAIQFLDGWTGRGVYLKQIWVCAHRHPTEAEAVACVRGPETTALAAATGRPVPGRTLEAPPRRGRQRAPSGSHRGVVPDPEWHPAGCEHKFCNCYDPASHQADPPCIHCRRRARHKGGNLAH